MGSNILKDGTNAIKFYGGFSSTTVLIEAGLTSTGSACSTAGGITNDY